jgi:hypothetical protein
MAEQPALLASTPGIKRDSTRFDNEHYIDGLWCRFQRGKPKKMGGYQQVTDTVPEITRGMHSYSMDDVQFLHLGHPNTIGQYQVSNGTLSIFNDRTPAGFVTDVNNLWQFDVFADTGGTGNHLLVAHAAPNALNIDNSVGGDIYIDTITAGTVLSTAGLSVDPSTGWNTGTFGKITGGIVVSGQYLFAYSSDGLIKQSAINDVSGTPLEFNLGTQKIVKGLPLRGAGSGPAVLMWALDSLIRGTFQPAGPPDFAWDIIARGITVLSAQGIVELDGIYYWPGVDRWLMFNGVVREIPNNMNQNWFFDNLNFTHRNKVFGFKVPRYGEIWWCYPRGNATECTHAVIYNVREGYWYDTSLPDSNNVNQGRTAGVFADVYWRPFMVDNFVRSTGGMGRTLWQHETAFDKIRTSQISAIRSFFETSELNLLDTGQSTQSIRCARIEPDFVQIGDMTVTMKGRANAKAAVTEVADVPTIFETPSTSDEETVKFKDVRRLMSFKFESNVAGGNYELGKTFAHIEPADGRVES